jgi:ClpP class serine protease
VGEPEVDDRRRSRSRGARGLLRILLWGGFALLVLQGTCQHRLLAVQRERVLDQLQQERHSRVIAMINRQETVSLLGIPVASYIDIEDSEAVLRAIRATPPDQPIDMILHTPGGLVLAAEQIAHALVRHPAKVTVIVPHYAMSGGTLIALAADEIVMDPNAVLGPVDPQIGDLPAASIVKVEQVKPPKDMDDQTLILADVAAKARTQVRAFVQDLLSHRFAPAEAQRLAETLTEGRWTHDYPILVEKARALGIPISEDVPALVYALMDLYPQSNAGRPSVLYTPLHRQPADGDHHSSTQQPSR